MNYTRHLAALTALSLTAGCNLGPADEPGAGLPPAAQAVSTTIADLNSGSVNDDTLVTVSGTLSTPLIVGDEDDNEVYFWIQDGSGPGTGMTIFTYWDVGSELESSLTPGDELTITGVYDHPFDSSPGYDQVRVTSIADVQATGTGSLPTPHVVDSSTIQSGFGDSALYGVIVTIEDVTAGEAPGWDNYFNWSADSVLIDSEMYTPDVEADFAIDSVTGVFHISYGDAAIWPRWASDVDFTYPGCEALTSPSPVQQTNCRVFAEDSDISLSGLVVTSGAPWYAETSFYVQDPAGADFSGILVYGIPDSGITPPAIGTVVDLEGEYEEYKGKSEIIVFNTDGITDTGSTATVSPLEVTDPCLINEAHEGLLVSVPSLTVGQNSDGSEYGYFTVSGCPQVVVGSDFMGSEAWGPLVPEYDAASPDQTWTITGLVGVVEDEYDQRLISARNDADLGTWEATAR